MDDPNALTISQAADALGVSERTVWRYLAAGRLPGETTGPPGSQRTLIARGAVEGLRAARGPDPDAAAVRAERDRLVAELARVQAERDRLAERVALLQRHLARPRRPGLQPRAAGTLMAGLGRGRGAVALPGRTGIRGPARG
jgi:excisionase family DNA binding protein